MIFLVHAAFILIVFDVKCRAIALRLDTFEKQMLITNHNFADYARFGYLLTTWDAENTVG